jgi:hypothetical protein
LRGVSYRCDVEVSADPARNESTRPRQQRLRRGLEVVGGRPCLGEDVTLDIVRKSLRISFRCLGLAVVIQVIRPEATPIQVTAQPRIGTAYQPGSSGA